MDNNFNLEYLEKIIKNGWPPKIPTVLELAGLPPKFGNKTKTRRKIKEANRKYKQKVKNAKAYIYSITLGKTMAYPLLKRINYDFIKKSILKIEPLQMKYECYYDKNSRS